MQNLEQSEVLKAIGLDEKNKWILHEEKPREFFKFIANSIDLSNILKNEEIEDYEKLLEARKVAKNEEDLQNELKNIEQSFPGFFSVTDDILEELECEVKELELDLQERSERLSRMKDYETEQLNRLAEIERKSRKIELKERLLAEECLERSKELGHIQKTNAQEIGQINAIYTQQPQSTTPSIMCQMPLDQYFTKCNQLLGLLEIYMNQNFNIIKGTDYLNDDDESQIEKIYQIKSEIIELEKKKFEEEMNAAGMNFLIENIDSYSNKVSGDFYEMKSIVDDLMMEKDSLEMNLNVLLMEGQMLTKDVTERKIIDVFHEFFKGKKKRASDRAAKVDHVHDLTDSIVYFCELLWIAIQLDLNRLKNRVDNSEEMTNQSQDCMKRIRQMKQMSSENYASSYSHQFLTSMQKLLIENLHCNKEELSSIEKCFQKYMNFDEEIQVVMKMLTEQKQLSKIQNSIQKIDEQSNILRDLIFCGPTSKPRLYDPKFIDPLYKKQQKKQEFEKIFNDYKIEFQSKVVEPFINDKFYRFKQLLYIWFCSEPQKVVLAIKEVQNKAAQEGSASYKALNITLSH